jgi:hypothetical protein
MADYKVYGKYNTQVFSNVTIRRNFNRYRRFGEYKCLSNVDDFSSLRGVTSKKTRNFMNNAVETTIPQKTDVLISVRLRHSWLIRTGTRKGRIILRSWLFLMCSGTTRHWGNPRQCIDFLFTIHRKLYYVQDLAVRKQYTDLPLSVPHLHSNWN